MARTYETAGRRWEGVGPYYAMFPTTFADAVTERFTKPGDSVLDPFAGRGTAVFSAAQAGRHAFGIEINPVGWVYGATKMGPAQASSVRRRLLEVGESAVDFSDEADILPEFFLRCYSYGVRRFLLAARSELDWRNSVVDRTTMALLMVHLHGKRGSALSNQMRQAKAMSPDYAVRWWNDRQLDPPELDPAKFMIDRLAWRYAKGIPEVASGRVYLGDSEELLQSLRSRSRLAREKVKLLLTSPPYFATTNYHYDQWLRLWLLGGPASARLVSDSSDVRGKFANATRYRELLRNIFSGSAEYLAKDSVIYVRTGAALLTRETTLEVLREVFHKHKLVSSSQPYTKPTQTSLFRNGDESAGEIDIVLYT